MSCTEELKAIFQSTPLSSIKFVFCEDLSYEEILAILAVILKICEE